MLVAPEGLSPDLSFVRTGRTIPRWGDLRAHRRQSRAHRRTGKRSSLEVVEPDTPKLVAAPKCAATEGSSSKQRA